MAAVRAILLVACCGVGLAQSAHADRTLDTAAYRDKLRGMWFGQLIGNHSGFESLYQTREPAPDSAFTWVIKTSPSSPWLGDDDTSFEVLYLHCLETLSLEPTPAEIATQWNDHVATSEIYFANRQAQLLIGYGFLPPETGTFRNNIHAYAIDSQITTESLGALSPGNRQWAIDACRRFGGVTNEGYALHAAQVYAAMYAAAIFETNVETLVAMGQATIPQTSRSWQVIEDVEAWFLADKADGMLDWRETRRLLYDYYHGAYDNGRFHHWVESTMNLGITTLAVLYGQGDFEETIKIGVLCGYDGDCNPATAGGLVGLTHGFSNLPAFLTDPATDTYKVLARPGLPEYDTISNIADRLAAIGEQVVQTTGGSVDGDLLTIPDEGVLAIDPEQPDPLGPAGLVAEVIASGGTVTTSASIEFHIPTEDRKNLDAMIDGITDIRHNGHMPYWTYDGDTLQPAGGDYYQLTFSDYVVIDGVTFYEGDALWGMPGFTNHGIDPRVSEMGGGYFTSLAVDVRCAGAWRTLDQVTFSEPLDPVIFFQVIAMTFPPVLADAVRIRGHAGGTHQFTTILELEVSGHLASDIADVDSDGDVDMTDVIAIVDCLTGPCADYPCQPPLITQDNPCQQADINLDGSVDMIDVALLMNAYTSPW